MHKGVGYLCSACWDWLGTHRWHCCKKHNVPLTRDEVLKIVSVLR